MCIRDRVHCVGVGAWLGDYGVGVTRGMVDGFLMANGQPIDVIQGWICLLYTSRCV